MASNWAGGQIDPLAQHPGEIAGVLSHVAALGIGKKVFTSSGVKKGESTEPTWLMRTPVPVRAAISRRPSASRAA